MGSFGANALYRSLGCKLVETVGGDSIPLKDVATTDALLLRAVPPPEAETARAVLATLAKAGIHCIVPTAVLAAAPLPGAVPLVPLKELEAKLLLRTGDGAGAGVGALGDSGRLAVTVAESDRPITPWAPSHHPLTSRPSDHPLQVTVAGDESDEQLATLCAREAEIDMTLLEVRRPPHSLIAC